MYDCICNHLRKILKMPAIKRFVAAMAFSVAVFGLIPCPVLGQSSKEHSDAEHHEGSEHHHLNELSLVVGGTYESEEAKTYFTVGVEYARWLTPHVSASVLVEHIGDVDAWVFIAPFHVRPWKSSELFFSLGPGIEHKSRREHSGVHEGEHNGHETPVNAEQSDNLFLWRIGIGYPFSIGKRLVLTPGIDLDFVRDDGEWVEAVVFDIAIGFGF
jgi:hypothetical protein